MKVNRLEMLIKFAAIYLCLNLVVLSVAAVPLSSEQQNADKESSGGTSKEDYDEVENTSEPASPPAAGEEVADTKPPLVFPESESAQTNATALEILQSNTPMANNTVEDSANSSSNSSGDGEKREDENNGSSQTQVDNKNNNIANNGSKNASKEADYDDHAETEETDAAVNGTAEGDAKKEKDYDEPASDDSDDEDVENFQEESRDQGDLEEKFGLNSTSINVFEEPTLKGGHIALIFASSLIILSAAAYVGMVLWRKSLEQRYGMRQRLVTEDDFYNNNDVRFFGL